MIAVLAVWLFSGSAFAQDIPEEARKQLAEAVGGPYIVFRDKVQDDLMLSTEQKGKLEAVLPERLQETGTFLQRLEGVGPAEREKELAEYRPKAREKLAAVLKETLKEDQLKRLRQLVLQQEGAFALGGEVGKELKVTDDQRKQFAAVVREMQKRIEPLIKEAQSGGNPEEIRPRAIKIRKEHEGKIEAILTDDQRKRWKEMLGKRCSASRSTWKGDRETGAGLHPAPRSLAEGSSHAQRGTPTCGPPPARGL
jgi:hypothetical protein